MWCGVCVVCCVSWCGVFGGVCVWHAENPPSVDFNTPPCVHSKRLRAYRQHVHMYKTCGRGASTHGNVLNEHTEAC